MLVVSITVDIFMAENYCILIKISLKFIPYDLTDNKSA